MSFKEEKQKVLIENLLSSTDLFTLCSNIVDPEYFDPEFRPSVSFIQEYYTKYNAIPPLDIISGETGVQFTIRPIHSDVFDYTANNVEKFCRERAVLKVFIEGASHIHDQNKFSNIVEQLTAATQISLFKDLGMDVMSDVAFRARNRNNDDPYFSTGWSNVDYQLGGGIRKREFMMISANSGGGKSVAMSNIALSFVKQKLNVLYISLELPESMICERFETMITGWDRETKIFKADELAEQVESVKREHNASIYVKSMEADATSTNDIKAYIHQFALQKGFYPDAVIVDYLDIMATNDKRTFTNEYQKDKIASTQLKSIASDKKHPVILVTASQQNRGAIDQQDVTQGNIAGGLSKVNIVDVYISIIMTDAMRLQGIAFFKFLKTRSSSGVGNRIPMGWDPKYLCFTTNNGPIVKDKPGVDEEFSITQEKSGFAVDKKISGIDSLLEM